MHQIKRNTRILITTLLLLLLFSGVSVKEAHAASKESISSLIDLTGIMREKDGDYLPNLKYATREELAQMLVQASTYVGEVANTNSYKLFKDVPKNSDKSSYIKIAVTKGYMSGYLNGMFKPDKAVTLKEAVYGTLSILGYTKDDFTGKLSDARYDTFKELGLSKNLTCVGSDKLTKEDCETLFYNLLNAKQKTGEIYCKTLGYSLNEDNVIDYQSVLQLKTKGPIVTLTGWEKQLSKKLSTYTILKNDIIISPIEIIDNSIVYYSEQANTIWVYDKKVFGTMESITYNQGIPQELVVSGTTYTVEKPEDMKNNLKNSTFQTGVPVVLLLGRDDKVSAVIKLSCLIAEVNWQNELTFDINQGTIYKNGVVVTSNDIASNNVIYYSKALKTIWVYDKKMYGVLETISPSLSAPESIVIAGKTYDLKLLPAISTGGEAANTQNLGENAWGARLRNNGMKEGDHVVVLFGYNGKVADIRAIDKMPITIAGYVLSIDDKLVKNENQIKVVNQVITIIDTDGVKREFPFSNSSISKGSIVEISFQTGKAVITKMDASILTNPPSDFTAKKIADNARIIEVKDQNYTVLSAAQLRESSWKLGNVLYYQLNSSGDITDLIVSNLTDSFYQFGVLQEVIFPNIEDGIYNYQIVLDLQGKQTNIVVDYLKWNSSPGPKAVRIEDGKLTDMQDLREVRISYIGEMQANTGDAVYHIADDVLVYFYKSGKYYKGELDDLTKVSDYRVYGYMKQQEPIKVIVVAN